MCVCFEVFHSILVVHTLLLYSQVTDTSLYVYTGMYPGVASFLQRLGHGTDDIDNPGIRDLSDAETAHHFDPAGRSGLL